MMRPSEFMKYHAPALEANEAKYNLILGLLGNPSAKELRLWTLPGPGWPGSCAIQYPDRPIVLGSLSEAQCHQLADQTQALDYPGVVGCDDTARWFVDEAERLGLRFRDPIPQAIHVLDSSPTYPAASGYARQVCDEDANLFLDWMLAFLNEAVPHDPKPSREQLETTISDGRFFFWIVDDQPVSMAGIARRTRNTAAISGVYTPPSLCGRGYAGSVTAAVAERIFAEWKTAACLYTDLRNPSSNRCYARVGFTTICGSLHYVRVQEGANDVRP